MVTDGRGVFYDVQLTACDPARCSFSILKETTEEKKGFAIHLAISPTKNPERLEWCVEKAVEIGVDIVTLVECSRTERASVKEQRLERVAISAMKQSWRATLPRVNALTTLDEFFPTVSEEDRYIAHVHPEHPDHLMHAARPGRSSCVLVGPEGDFTESEIKKAQEHRFSIVSLGAYRLRTESAGVAAVHILNLVNL